MHRGITMKKQRGGTILGFILGLVVGLGIALGVAVYITKVPLPFMNKGQTRSADQNDAETKKNKDWDPNALLSGKPVPKATVPADAASEPGAAPEPPPLVPAPEAKIEVFVPGKWYLLGFGLLGGGELFYVYYLNFIVSCSKPERMRENTAYTTLVTVTIGIMPILFGLLSDRYGLRASFVAAIGILVLALVLEQTRLPKQPTVL